MNTIRFEENTPVEVALKYSSGKHVNGKFGEQVMYSLKSGEVMYVPVIVEKKLQELNAKPGDPLQITKAKANGKVTWNAARIEPCATTPKKPQAAAELLNGSASLDGIPDAAATPVQRQEPQIQTRLEFALKTALLSAKRAELYAAEIDCPSCSRRAGAAGGAEGGFTSNTEGGRSLPSWYLPSGEMWLLPACHAKARRYRQSGGPVMIYTILFLLIAMMFFYELGKAHV